MIFASATTIGAISPDWTTTVALQAIQGEYDPHALFAAIQHFDSSQS